MKIKGIQRVQISGEFPNVTEFHKEFPCSRITEIDGKTADAVCESCEKAITVGEKCFHWNDMVFTCMDCGSDQEGHKPMILTP